MKHLVLFGSASALVGVLAIVTSLRAADAPATAPATQGSLLPPGSPQEAAYQMFQSLGAGDAAAFRAMCIITTPEEDRLVGAIGEMFAASADRRAAINEKFPNVDARYGELVHRDDPREAVETVATKSKVQIDGDHATVTMPNGQPSVFHFGMVDGQWRLWIGETMDPFWQNVHQTPDQFFGYTAAHAKVDHQVAKDIRDGKYASLARLASQFRRMHEQADQEAQDSASQTQPAP